MKSGQVKPYRGDSLLVTVGIWAKQDKGGSIHIHLASRPHFHSTITNKLGRKRYHPSLFKALKSLLVNNGRWQFHD